MEDPPPLVRLASMQVVRRGSLAAVVLAALALVASASAHDEPFTPDVTVEVSGPAALKVGETATFVITIKNRGQVDAHLITVTDDLPVELNYVTAWTTLGECWGAGSSVKCVMPGLPSFAKATVTIIAKAAAPGVVTNIVRAVSTSPEFNAADNSGGATFEITAPKTEPATPAPVAAPAATPPAAPAATPPAAPPAIAAPAAQQPAKPKPKKKQPPKKKR